MSSPGSRWSFWLAMAAYVLLVLLFGMPILLADCGGSGDLVHKCAAAQRANHVYRAAALLIAALAMWLRWQGSRWAVPLLLAGSVLPLIATLIFERLTG